MDDDVNTSDPFGTTDEERLEKYQHAARERGLVFNGQHLPYYKGLRKHARELRTALTECEKRVMGFLKSRGLRFRVQHPIDFYIVDFYLPNHHLVIEVDGEQHITTEGKVYDEYRDEIMHLYELRVLRISNRDIRANAAKAFQRILDATSEPS
jgi:very-short-patch-repair endonuclease